MKKVILLLWFAFCSTLVPGNTASDTTPPEQMALPGPSPLRILGEFLELSQSQASQIEELIRQFTLQMWVTQEQIQPRQARLEQLLQESTPNPAAVGQAILEIRAIQQQLQQARAALHESFRGLLTEAQLDKVRAVEQALHLQPAVQVFAALHLIQPSDGPQRPPNP